MKGYINLRDLSSNCRLEHISAWHEQEFNSDPFKKIKGNNIGDKIKYCNMLLINKDQSCVVKVAYIIPSSGHYEHPVLIRLKDITIEIN